MSPFAGVNYGLIEAPYSGDPSYERVSLERVYGFSFTGGARVSLGRGVYAAGYGGLTSNAAENRVFGDFFPRIGAYLGYAW